MRINTHAHIFNLKSVFSVETLNILVDRLTREKWPAFITEAVRKLLGEVLKGEYLDEDRLLKEFLKSIKASEGFKAYLGSLNKALPAETAIILEGDMDGLQLGALRELVHKLGELIEDNDDAENQTLADLVAFLHIGIRPTMDEVADLLMQQAGPDSGVVALMMDIATDDGTDSAMFVGQIGDTSRLAAAYPGRMFPFFAVNTRRKNHFPLLMKATQTQGFVGVKLYPSLGYQVDSPEMDKVFNYCAENNLPLLMHCNHGGFWAKQAYRDYSSPFHWDAILAKYPSLKICFGHFGGDENLIGQGITNGSWTEKILDLMRRYAGVYADIAYHTSPMKGGVAETNYFDNIRGLLNDPVLRERVLFGTDYFLVRLRLREDNHWRYFEKRLGEANFEQMAVNNAHAFLGLPAAQRPMTGPISQLVDFLYGRRFEARSHPAPWVEREIKARYGEAAEFLVNPLGAAWAANNAAHVQTWYFFIDEQMYPMQQKLFWLQAGALRMRQMKYWNKEHEAPAIYQRKCMMVAENMNTYFLSKGAVYEPDVNRLKAENSLFAALAFGDTRLADISLVVDRMYRFKSERQVIV